MLTLILSTSLLLSSVLVQSTRKDIDPKLVPMSGATTKAFVPKGWKSQDEQMGDLNGDGLPDAVLQLIQDLPNAKGEFQERSRALLILFKTSDGKYARAAVAARVLMCAGCGGMLGGTGDTPGADVEIEKGVLLVSQLSGSRELTNLLQRFRYDAPTKQFLLIGQDITSADRLTGDSETSSTNYLTGKQVIETIKKGKLVAKKTKLVAKTRKTIEQVDYEQ